MDSKIRYGLLVPGSPLHMRDPSHGRHDAEENGTLFFSRRPPIVAAMFCSSQHQVVGRGIGTRLGCVGV